MAGDDTRHERKVAFDVTRFSRTVREAILGRTFRYERLQV